LITTGVKVTERTFRAYWQQVSDPQALRGLRGRANAARREDCERECFRAIAALAGAGEKPDRPERLKQPPSPEAVRAARQARQEGRGICERLRPTLAFFKGLMGRDRCTFTMFEEERAKHLEVLQREMQELARLARVRDA
jgi:hypothetical protein